LIFLLLCHPSYLFDSVYAERARQLGQRLLFVKNQTRARRLAVCKSILSLVLLCIRKNTRQCIEVDSTLLLYAGIIQICGHMPLLFVLRIAISLLGAERGEL
jgi:hypothetical protein